MTNEVKYYQPEIEEFHHGFEYELFEDFDSLPEKIWHKQVYGKNGANPENMDYVSFHNLKNIRVKYLSKECIEELGWKMQSGPSDFVFGNYQLENVGDIEDEWMITKDRGDRVIFEGYLKNKSELKKLMQQLRIL